MNGMTLCLVLKIALGLWSTLCQFHILPSLKALQFLNEQLNVVILILWRCSSTAASSFYARGALGTALSRPWHSSTLLPLFQTTCSIVGAPIASSRLGTVRRVYTQAIITTHLIVGPIPVCFTFISTG